MSEQQQETVSEGEGEAWENAILTGEADGEASDEAEEQPAADEAEGEGEGADEAEGETEDDKPEDEESLAAERAKLNKRGMGLDRKAKRIARRAKEVEQAEARLRYTTEQFEALRTGDAETAMRALRAILGGKADPYQFLTDLNLRMVGEQPADEPGYVKELRDELRSLKDRDAEREAAKAAEQAEQAVIAQYASTLKTYDMEPYPEVADALASEGASALARVVHVQHQRTGLAGAKLMRYLCAELRDLGYGAQRDDGAERAAGAGQAPRENAKPGAVMRRKTQAITQASSRDVPRSSLVEMTIEERRRRALDYINT